MSLKPHIVFRIHGLSLVPQFEVQVRAVGELAAIAGDGDDFTGFDIVTGFFE